MAWCAQELSDSVLSRLLEKVKAVYGVDLHFAQGPASKFKDIDYDLAQAPDKQALEKAILLFVQEISRYPAYFFRSANCRDIYFVQNLFYQQKPVDGIFSAGKNYIFYDTTRHSGNPQMIRHYIHHELYHMIASRHPFWKKHGPIWEALNRRGFSYHQKNTSHERNPINFSAPLEPGFITDYAMVSSEEDRAEVFACMMISQELGLMEEWAQKDRILFNKVEMMKEFLKRLFNGG